MTLSSPRLAPPIHQPFLHCAHVRTAAIGGRLNTSGNHTHTKSHRASTRRTRSNLDKKDGLTVRLPRDGSTFSPRSTSAPRNLAGFAVRAQPRSQTLYLITADFTRRHCDTEGVRHCIHPSNEAPLQKFRWSTSPRMSCRPLPLPVDGDGVRRWRNTQKCPSSKSRSTRAAKVAGLKFASRAATPLPLAYRYSSRTLPSGPAKNPRLHTNLTRTYDLLGGTRADRRRLRRECGRKGANRRPLGVLP